MVQTTTCAIVGGGPAGMVLGLLLARAGVEVTLLEKHGDFLRDFRGDTVHPTTMRLLDELGLWERFAELPFTEVRKAQFESSGRSVTYVDFERLRSLRRHRVTGRDLAAVRRRRVFPTAVTQAVQRVLHRRLVGPMLRGADPTPLAALFTLMKRLPWLSALPAYFIGVGVRPEHAPPFARRGPGDHHD
jgi:2-polyprenyl-6-methoxyphenol hydroxylase-like FAD-dependent oxidoreductase